MKILLVDNGTSYLENIKSLLKDYFVTVVSYFDIPSNYSSYNLLLLSGGHTIFINKNNEKFLFKEIDMIRNSNVPLIGICYGSELINYAFGGSLKSIKKAKGIKIIEKTLEDRIFDGINTTLEVFENHNFAIDNLAPELVSLASSKTGVEIYKHKTKSIIGLQFHPEMFVNKAVGDEIFFNCLNIVSRFET